MAPNCEAIDAPFDGPQNETTSISYMLFLYREELRRFNARFLKLSTMKIDITQELISKTVQNIAQCSVEDLEYLSREMVFKRKLRNQVQRMKKLQMLGIRNPDPKTLSSVIL